MDSKGPLFIRQGIFHKANVPNNDILPRYVSRDTTLPAQNSRRVKFLHVVLQRQKQNVSHFLQNTSQKSCLLAKKLSALSQDLMYGRGYMCLLFAKESTFLLN